MRQEVKAASLEAINDYAASKHEGKIACRMTEEKGRILVAKKKFTAGEVIFVEPPLHIVVEQPEDDVFNRLKGLCAKHDFLLEPMWYWSALCSCLTSEPTEGVAPESSRDSSSQCQKSVVASLGTITLDTQRNLLTLFAPPTTDPSEEATLLVREFGIEDVTDALLVERLLQAWVHNCFEYKHEPIGYAVYLMSSFCSHSCVPNACWSNDPQGNFVLAARADIEAEDEISITYLSEDDLLRITSRRQNWLLTTKGFLCTCLRCTAPSDLCRGFKCPKCHAGEVFLSPLQGYQSNKLAGNPSGLQSRTQTKASNVAEAYRQVSTPSCEAVICGKSITVRYPIFLTQMKAIETFYGSVLPNQCLSCGHSLTKKELQSFIFAERRLETHVAAKLVKIGAEDAESDDETSQEYEDMIRAKPESVYPLSSKFSSLGQMTDNQVNELILRFLSQHSILLRWLLYRSHALKCEISDDSAGEWQTSNEELIENIQSKFQLINGMYPPLGAAIAWCYEEFADQLAVKFKCASSRYVDQRTSGVLTPEATDEVYSSASRVHQQAVDSYELSLTILRIMFGEEYAAEPSAKLAALPPLKKVFKGLQDC